MLLLARQALDLIRMSGMEAPVMYSLLNDFIVQYGTTA
jgi:hypothetical protein